MALNRYLLEVLTYPSFCWYYPDTLDTLIGSSLILPQFHPTLRSVDVIIILAASCPPPDKPPLLIVRALDGCSWPAGNEVERFHRITS